MAEQAIYVDIGDVSAVIEKVKKSASTEKIRENAGKALRDVSKSAISIIAKASSKEYAVTQKWVKSNIRSPQVNISGLSVKIPISGHRGVIGDTFKAPVKKGKNSALSAKILKSKASSLPIEYKHQNGIGIYGANSFSGGKKNVALTLKKVSPYTASSGKRAGQTRSYKLVRIAGVSAAQMPANLAKNSMDEQLHDRFVKRFEHYFTINLTKG